MDPWRQQEKVEKLKGRRFLFSLPIISKKVGYLQFNDPGSQSIFHNSDASFSANLLANIPAMSLNSSRANAELSGYFFGSKFLPDQFHDFNLTRGERWFSFRYHTWTLSRKLIVPYFLSYGLKNLKVLISAENKPIMAHNTAIFLSGEQASIRSGLVFSYSVELP